MNFNGGSLGTAGGMRPGTTMRPGTNRVQIAGVGGSLQQPVAVTAEAPVTREGMRAASRSGVGTSAGPGRQVGDRSYYIGLLRPRIAELSSEIDRLNEQEELINKNSDVLGQLQQRAKSLQDEMAKLKSSLADVNLAVECCATRDAAAVRAQSVALAESNTARRKQVDDLFLSVKEAGARTRSNQRALEEEMQLLDRRLRSEGEDYDAYAATRAEAFAASDLVLSRQHEVRTLTAMQELLLANLARDTDKRKAADTLRAIIRKRQEKDTLTQQCALSVEEEKQLLIRQVRATRSDSEVLERQVNDTRDAVQESKARIAALEEEAKNYSGDNVQAFQALQERDAEMQRLVDEFPAKEAEELAKIETTRQSIVQLLERITRGLELQRQMPAEGSPSALQALSTEVDARRDQIENDQRTHQRIEQELLERKAELDKVASLDRKITEELQSHATTMARQRAEMQDKYSDLDALRRDVEKLRTDLIAQKTYLTRVREHGKREVNEVAARYEAEHKRLTANDINATLAAQEQKLRMLWQSTYSLEEFVRLQEKETQYLGTKAECLRMVDEINIALKDPQRMNGFGGAPILTVGER